MKKLVLIFFLLHIYHFVISQVQPPSRWAAYTVYDEVNRNILLFGGVNGDNILTDTWSFDGKNWQEISKIGPKDMNKGLFVYDIDKNRSILFCNEETWEFKNKTWAKLNISGPSSRVHALGAYDKLRRSIVIFGGFGNAGVLSDTWLFDGEKWKLVNSDGPKNCIPQGLIYDENQEAVIMVTVRLALQNQKTPLINEMWKWTGVAWENIPVQCPETSISSIQSLAPFGKNGIVMFDGDDISNNNGATWLFTGRKWEKKYLPGPSPRVASAMVFDFNNNKVILFGGSNRKEFLNDTWEFDGDKWSKTYKIKHLNPIGRSQHAACFDSQKGEMLVFGGSKHYRNKTDSTEKIDNKLWAWNGEKWKILSQTGPTWREDAKMVFHEKNNKTYLLGGRNYDANGKANVLNEFWEWNGLTWRLISSPNPMGKRLHTNMIYDTKRNKIVLFGGVDIEKGFINDVWEWDKNKWKKANHYKMKKLKLEK